MPTFLIRCFFQLPSNNSDPGLQWGDGKTLKNFNRIDFVSFLYQFCDSMILEFMSLSLLTIIFDHDARKLMFPFLQSVRRHKFRVSSSNWNLLKWVSDIWSKIFLQMFLWWFFASSVYVRNLRVVGCSTVCGVSLRNNCAAQNRTHASCKGQGSDQCSVPKLNKV